MTSTHMNPAAVLQQMLGGATAASLIYVAAELGLADLLADGPCTTAELIRRTSCHPDALERVLRGLVVIGILEPRADDCYALAPLGSYLRSDMPGSALPLARLMGHPTTIRAWGGLLHTAMTGQSAFEHALGTDFASYFLANADFGQTFNTFMGTITAQVAPAVVSAYDFTGVQTIVDVGGGNGTLLRAILRSYPSASGYIFDLPHAEIQAEQAVAADKLDGRCRFIAGDFFERVPAGADAYLLKSVLHDWDDATCVRILQSVKAALRADSRVLIVERPLLANGAFEPDVIMSDLTMLAMVHGGRERTQAEYERLLEQAGLRLDRVVPTSAVVNVFEARAA